MKVSNWKVYELEESILASAYPMRTNTERKEMTEKDVKRAISLANSQGGGHNQFLSGILVAFDLTCSNKMWVEVERYRFLTFVSSQSTMHRITRFDLDSAYVEHVDPRIVAIMKEKVADYNYNVNVLAPIMERGATDPNNDYGAKELEDFKRAMSEKYLQILYSNPTGFKLTARITTNYRQLKTMYHQRKNHRLPEWREFCRWIETLPHAELITSTGDN